MFLLFFFSDLLLTSSFMYLLMYAFMFPPPLFFLHSSSPACFPALLHLPRISVVPPLLCQRSVAQLSLSHTHRGNYQAVERETSHLLLDVVSATHKHSVMYLWAPMQGQSEVCLLLDSSTHLSDRCRSEATAATDTS